MLRSLEAVFGVESIKFGPIRHDVQENCEERWSRVLEISGGHLNWREETFFADTREALLLEHEKSDEAKTTSQTNDANVLQTVEPDF